MKAEQSSLYRNLEILHLWALETFANAPKEQGVRVNVKIIIESIIDAQTAIAIALNCENLKQKFDLLDVVVMIYKYAYLKGKKHTIKIKQKYNIGEIRYAKDRLERARMSSALHGTPQRRSETGINLHRCT